MAQIRSNASQDSSWFTLHAAVASTPNPKTSHLAPLLCALLCVWCERVASHCNMEFVLYLY